MTQREALEETYALVSEHLLGESEIDEGRLFSATGLRTRGKIFVMLARAGLVVKLPAARCAELVAEGRGEQFEAGGRKLREWVTLVDPSPDEAIALSHEALTYLRELFGPNGRRKP
jgi:hypothetical protein